MSQTAIVTMLVVPLLAAGAAAQRAPRYTITEGRLAEALAEARDDRTPPLAADVLAMRVQRGDLRTPAGDAVFPSAKAYASWRDKNPPPFIVVVASPYMRALFTAFEARRRYVDPPSIGAAALNRDGVLVSVVPGEDFARADAIEDVVLKRFDGQAIHPVRRQIDEVTLQNRQGASRTLTEGAFYFRLEDFEDLPLTLV